MFIKKNYGFWITGSREETNIKINLIIKLGTVCLKKIESYSKYITN